MRSWAASSNWRPLVARHACSANVAVDHNPRLGEARARMHDRSPSTTELTDTERLNRLRLIRSDNVGPRGIMAQTPQAAKRGLVW
ncbi:hypothetical protein [Bradyrhizobium altum]|uniref:hypothetical protein n=1 Tax=Bradyrhizobium altum TaxID=1571202 RepID=UPI0035E35826